MTLESVYKDIIEYINREFGKELKAQGHGGSGALIRSIAGRVLKVQGGDQIQGRSFDYAQILNKGVAAGRIPFNEGSGAKSSKFITALTLYFRKKGLSASEAKSAAFATAKKMKKEGMPTKGSFQYSKNGYRTRFIEIVASAVEQNINKKMLTGVKQVMSKEFHKTKSETI